MEARRHAPGRGWTTLLLVVVGIAFLAIAWAVGISDNPPGIVLTYLGIGTLIVAAVHRWREPRKFLWLLLVSALGLIFFAFVHNLGYAAAESETADWFQAIMGAVSVTAFLLAVLVCPAGCVVGAVGALVARVRRHE